jgi:hypothetical protein
MAAKTAFVLEGFNIRVSEDWVVGMIGIEPMTLSRYIRGADGMPPRG